MKLAHRHSFHLSVLLLLSFLASSLALYSYPPRAHADATVIFLTSTSGSAQSWNVPSDWNSSNNTIEVIGGGAGGITPGGIGGGGGGGGAYSRTANLTLTPSGTASFFIGAAATAGNAGADAWLSNTGSAPTSTSEGCLAEGGGVGSGSTGGTGGAAANGIGDATTSGGDGGTPGGGGGAAGPNGNGANGGESVFGGVTGGGGGGGANGGANGDAAVFDQGGAGGNGRGATGGGTAGAPDGGDGSDGGGGGGGDEEEEGASGDGGDGGADLIWTQTSDSAQAGPGGGGGGGAGGNNANSGFGGSVGADAYGGGGGGAGLTNNGIQNTAGAGGQGIIVITYTPIPIDALDAPTDLITTSVTGGVNLSWTAPASTGGSNLETYGIWRATSSFAATTSASLIASIATTSTTYSDTSVALRTNYYYRVTATNSTATSSLSNQRVSNANSGRIIRLGGLRLR